MTYSRESWEGMKVTGRSYWLMWLAPLGLTVGLLLAAAACGGEESAVPQTATPTVPTTPAVPATPGLTITPPASTPEIEPCQPQAPEEGQANLFHNPGFEAGEDPWCSLRLSKFQVSEELPHSGQSSALLIMKDPAEATGYKAYQLVQEVTPGEFPEFISGYYRVENWRRGTYKQYLQFTVVVFDAANLSGDYPNHQIRYLLAGMKEQPLEVGNAQFVFLSKEDPPVGEWVYFERDVKQDFQELWGGVPEGFSKIRVMFEVRWDDKEALATAEADAYFDDLYMGPASANPNRSGS